MRKRQPKHENQLKSLESAATAEVIRRIGVGDYAAADFLDSEVLAALIRNRFRESDSIMHEAIYVLNKRIQVLVGKRLRNIIWDGMTERGSTVIEDTIDYVWDKLLEEEGVSNSEAYFGVFVQDRVDDYMRHLLTQKNSMKSIDSMTVDDEEGNQTPLIDTITDGDAETPEEILIRTQETAAMRTQFASLPQPERSAFYFRIICEYDWSTVANLMDCSIPTARQHLKRSLEKLQGVME